MRLHRGGKRGQWMRSEHRSGVHTEGRVQRAGGFDAGGVGLEHGRLVEVDVLDQDAQRGDGYRQPDAHERARVRDGGDGEGARGAGRLRAGDGLGLAGRGVPVRRRGRGSRGLGGGAVGLCGRGLGGGSFGLGRGACAGLRLAEPLPPAREHLGVGPDRAAVGDQLDVARARVVEQQRADAVARQPAHAGDRVQVHVQQRVVCGHVRREVVGRGGLRGR
ncbi:hypothetical protein DFJ74DRAFT_679530 [Hyaloraphidium curvatum]|nr:hypothetical protein DFJ74DRAFT_679530 [Hyaloraphidium curvatum]